MAQERNYNDECGDHGGTNRDGDPCGRPAGWGTRFDSGKCKNHRGTNEDGSSHEGNDFAKGNDGGPPDDNQNAQQYALHADPEKYHANLDEEAETWVFEMTEVICDRLRSIRGDVDPLDRTLARRIAIKLHIVSTASEHISREGIFQTIEVTEGDAEYEKEIPHAALSELRQYDSTVMGELKKLGVLSDPDTKRAEALKDGIDLTLSTDEKQSLANAFDVEPPT